MTRPTIQDLRAGGQKAHNDFAGSVRRMSVTSTDGLLWGVAGGEDAGGNLERDELEVFGIPGITSRPAGDAEAIVVAVGGRGHTVIVATRAPSMSAGVAEDDDEIAISTSKRFVRITAAGEVLIGAPDGTFERVVTESHVHGAGTFASIPGTAGGPLVTGGISGRAVANPGTTLGETDRFGRGLAADLKAGT